MNQARDDFLASLAGLRKAAADLPTVDIGSDAIRSAPFLTLNGLRVVAFASVEEFVRQRAYEVVSWLGSNAGHALRFDELPTKLGRFAIEGAIKGLANSLSFRTTTDRVTQIQLESLLLGTTADNSAPFKPSEYFFGRLSSNISAAEIRGFVTAMSVKEGLSSLANIADRVGMAHLASQRKSLNGLLSLGTMLRTSHQMITRLPNSERIWNQACPCLLLHLILALVGVR